MTTYYKLKESGKIDSATTNAEVATALGLNLTTDREIVFGYDGGLYFKGEEPKMPVTIADYDAAMETRLKDERHERGYTTREPSDYRGSRNPRWAQDAEDWIAHRDDVMEYALKIENDVAAHLITPPTVEEFLAAMPVINWTFKLED